MNPLFLAFLAACIAAWAFVAMAAQALFTGRFNLIALLVFLAILGWFWREIKIADKG